MKLLEINCGGCGTKLLVDLAFFKDDYERASLCVKCRELVEDFKLIKCECGGEAIGSSYHSYWCPKDKYKKRKLSSED